MRFVANVDAHLGGDLSTAERSILESAGRLHLIELAHFARWCRLQNDEDAASVRAVSGQRLKLLAALGLKRKPKELNLSEYLQSKAQGTPVIESGTIEDGEVTEVPAGRSANTGDSGASESCDGSGHTEK
jgi:hypothetical protein